MSLVSRIPSGKNSIKHTLEYITIDSDIKLNSMIETIKKEGVFSFDTETSSLKPFDSNLVGISISVKPNSGWYIPINHDSGNNISSESILLKVSVARTAALLSTIAFIAIFSLLPMSVRYDSSCFIC